MTVFEAADVIVKSAKKRSVYVEPAQNPLFRSLYNGLCRIEGSARRFEDLVREAEAAARTGKKGETDQRVYGRAFRKLWNWYLDRYGQAEEGEKKQNGIDRSVKDPDNAGEELARFRTPFRYRSFLNYLRNGNPVSGVDGYAFLLHTAVAFLLPPEEADRLLVACGYMPLHIKNLFHVAIHVVLSARQARLSDRSNPFDEVEDCYREELAVLNREEADLSAPLDGEEEAFAAGSTRVIQNYVAKFDLSRSSMLRFIERHRSVFQRRHARLVAEHKYLVDLFSELYMRNEIDDVRDRNDEALYSLYSFQREFCRSEKTNRDTFRSEIYGKVARQAYHPTREFMILLWLFAFSFLYLPEVREEMWEGSVRNYAALIPFGAGTERPFAPFVSAGRLQVLRYLSCEDSRSAPLKGFYDEGGSAGSQFFGSALIQFLNDRLEDYSWRPLDARSPFDRIVKSLGDLDFTLAEGEEEQRLLAASFRGVPLTGPELSPVENVPYLLVLVTELLQAVKTGLNGSLPLACRCCEIM